MLAEGEHWLQVEELRVELFQVRVILQADKLDKFVAVGTTTLSKWRGICDCKEVS